MNNINVNDNGTNIVLDSVFNDILSASINCDLNELTIEENSNYTIIGEVVNLTSSPSDPFIHDLFPPPSNYAQTPVSLGQIGGIITPIYEGTYSSYMSGLGKWVFNIYSLNLNLKFIFCLSNKKIS